MKSRDYIEENRKYYTPRTEFEKKYKILDGFYVFVGVIASFVLLKYYALIPYIVLYFIQEYKIDEKVKEDRMWVDEYNKEMEERAARIKEDEKEHRDWLRKQDNKKKKTKNNK